MRARMDRDDRLMAKKRQPMNNSKLLSTYASMPSSAADRKPNDRVDFAETLYWNAGIRTDANGKARVILV